jgi:hypothetical protein
MKKPTQRRTVTLNDKTWFKILDKLNKASYEDHSWGGRTIISSDHTLEMQLCLAMQHGQKEPK